MQKTVSKTEYLMVFWGNFSQKISAIILILGLVNVILPQKVLASGTWLQPSNLGELRNVIIYNPQSQEPKYVVIASRYLTVTAYTSCPEETDSTPFTTANGQTVRDGIIAANFLPFGTKVRFPDYFGDKIFEVQDRMNARYYYRADIWMTEKSTAKQFGKRNLKIEILKEQLKEPAIVTMK